MCGVAGWIIESGDAPPGGTIDAMLDTIAHRGPDDCGTYHARAGDGMCDVTLGHRRLAIIDPEGARQPMSDTRAGLTLVFNGEIYNFRDIRARLLRHGYAFEYDSDTEVLLRAYEHWGTNVVHELRGAFAFALWDARRHRLVLARDRFGEKPLYLYRQGRNLYFASEIKALLQLPRVRRAVNLDSVWDYLAYRYVPAPATLFEGIVKLMPGTFGVFEHGTLTQSSYWRAPDADALVAARTPDDPVGEFTRRLDDAVALQMVSDVPFGAFLSGGIDSSMIVALMSRHSADIKTFSIGFREQSYSELDFAGEVASHFGTDHHTVHISHEDVVERLESLVELRDAPVSEPSDVAIHLLAGEAAHSVKMVLTGEGSDELLGGYPKHVAERFASTFQRLPAPLRHGLVAPLAHALPYEYRRVKTAVTNLNIEAWRERQARWFGALDDRERSALSSLRRRDAPPHAGPPFDGDPSASSLRRILYFDQTSWLPDNLLERTDRMTMAASLEARVPFLDHELAAYVSCLPDRYRVRRLSGKWLLREAGKRVIPERILKRPKVGFRVPVNEWFRGPLRDYVREHLQGAGSLTREYYDARRLDELLDEHFTGRRNHEKLLWTLLGLEIWHRTYA